MSALIGSPSTINLLPTKNIQVIKSVYDLEPNLTHEWLLIIKDNNIVGMFEIQPLSKITGIVHLHIKEEFQKQGVAIEAMNALTEYLKPTPIKQLIGSIAVKNKHIMSIVNKTKARCCGLISNGIIWNNELQDIALFQLEVI
jgi:hypothetical protein